MARRIGIYAGTFDPVHAGHVAFAGAALSEAGLHEVVFLPERSPRGKQRVSPLNHRAAMLGLGLQAEPRFELMLAPQMQFTVAETLPYLKKRFSDGRLVLLLGSDVALGLKHWPGLEQLLAQADVAVGLRAPDSRTAVEQELGDLLPRTQFYFIQTPQAGIAARQVRQELAAAASLALHPDVHNYAQRYGLY